MKRIIIISVAIFMILIINSFAISSKSLGIVNPYQPITYDTMMDNLKQLAEAHPDLIQMEVIGKSVDDRDIVLVKLGKGDTLIHINGSFHARERITTNIILKNIEDYCEAYIKDWKIQGYDVKSLLDEVTIYFVPMVNPDGVDYTINGESAIRNPKLLEDFKGIKVHPASEWFVPDLRWKANIRGVDLNRQWDFGWEEPSRFDIDGPADAHFKGFKPHSEPEAKALEKLTIENPFLIYSAYHSQGLEIYWYKYQEGEDLEEVKDLTMKIANLTYFRPVPAINSIPEGFRSYSGYADWTAIEFKKPSFTMEFAYRDYSEEDFDKIYTPAKALPLLFAQEALAIKEAYNVEVIVNGKTYQLFKRPEDALSYKDKYLSKDMDITILDDGEVIFEEKGKPYIDLVKVTFTGGENAEEINQQEEKTPALRFRGGLYLPVEDVFNGFSLTVNHYRELDIVVAEGSAKLVILSLDKGIAFLNHKKLDYDNSVVEYEDEAYISTSLLERIFDVEINIDDK